MLPGIKITLHIIKYLFLILVLLFILLVAVVNLPFVHTVITKKANSVLSEKEIPVHIGKITLLLNGKIGISQLEIIRPQSDTIIYAGKASVDIYPFALFSKELVIKNIRLTDVVANIFTDSITGEMNIISVFNTKGNESKKPENIPSEPEKAESWDVKIESISLGKIKFQYSDPAGGILVQQKLEKAAVEFNYFSLINRQIDIETVEIDKPAGLVSIWNATKKTEDKTDEPLNWKFSLQNLEIDDLLFTFDQPDAQQKIDVALKSGNISLEKLDLATQEILVSKIELKEPVIDFTTTGNSETQTTNETIPFEFSIPTFSWSVLTEELNIRNGSFNYHIPDNKETTTLQRWLPIQDLNAAFTNIKLTPDGYNLNLEKMSFALANTLKLKSGSLVLNIDSIQNINIQTELTALLNSDKKSWFAKDSLLTFSAKITGSDESVKIENTGITSSSGLSLQLDGSIQRPFQPTNAKCDLNFRSGSISRSQVGAIVKHFSPNIILPGFQPFSISGSLKNSYTNPFFKFNVNSKSGKIAAGGNFNAEKYRGELEATFSEIMLRELLGEIYPEKLTGSIRLKGGFKPGKLPEGEVLINLDSVLYKNKSTKNIVLQAFAGKNKIDFIANVSDSAAFCDFTGFFELKNKNAFAAGIKGGFDIDLFAMNLYTEHLSGKGNIDAGFDYSPEKMNALGKITGFTINNKKNTSTIDETLFELMATDSLTESKLNSGFLKANFRSHASLTDFKNAFDSTKVETIINLDSTNFLNLNAISNLEQFNLAATVHHNQVFNLFYPDSVLNFSDINIDIYKNDINSDVESKISTDWISYNVVKSYNPLIHAQIEDNKLNFNINTDSIVAQEVKFGKSEINIDILPTIILGEFNVNNENDSILHRIGFKAERTGEIVSFESSGKSWLINKMEWNLSPPQFLSYNNTSKTYSANFDLHSGEKRILLSGNSSDRIELDIQNIELNNLAIPGIIGFAPEGKINANVLYRKTDKDNLQLKMEMLQMKWGDIHFDRLAAEGQMIADSTGISESKISVSADDSLSLLVDIESNSSKKEILLKSEFKKLNFKLFEPFINEYANQLHGTSNGKIVLSKTGEKTQINGEIGFNDFGMKVLPLKTWLTIPDNKIKIEQNQLIFNNFTVIDSLKRPLTVNGKIDFENKENIWADLKVKADNILIMNTTETDNPGFFGSININSGLDIKGSVFSPEIKGNIDLESGTNLTYQLIQDLTVEQTQKDVVFATITDSLQIIYPETDRGKKTTKMPMIETLIRINPKSIFNVKITDLYNVDISITGDGLLNYTLLPNNTMSLNGKYEISSGICKLKITGWPLKDFNISKGSSFRWNGNVENPELNLEATSKVKGSYMNPIDNKSRPVDFIVSMQLKNQLSELGIVFGIQSDDQYITSVLNSLSSDEIMRQAVNLLLFETIDLPGMESSGNYLASQMNSFWESQLNALTRTTFNKTALSFGIDTYNQKTASGGQQEKTSFTYEMERKIMKDRGTVKISGKLNDYSEGGYQTNSIFENFIFEYALDKNDTKYLKLYQKRDYEDMLEGEVIKYGAGFLYRKNYYKMRDIWQSGKKRKQAKQKTDIEK